MDPLLFYRQEMLNNDLIFDFKTAEVNGDEITDDVYLVGTKPLGPDSILVSDIKIVVKDGNDGSRHTITPAHNAGYAPTIFLGDFTQNQKADILLSIGSGSTGLEGYFYVYTFLNNIEKKIFDFEEFNALSVYKVTYQNNYKVEITNDKTYTIDLRNKDQEYKAFIYNNDGTLKRPTTGRISPIINLIPVAISNQNNSYELNAVQRIIGYYEADVLGVLTTRLRFDGNKMSPVSAMVNLFVR